MDKERELLIQTLREYFFEGDPYDKLLHIEDVADFILKDRERIVRPLVECKNKVLKYSGLIGWITLTDTLTKPVDETLKLSGISND